MTGGDLFGFGFASAGSDHWRAIVCRLCRSFFAWLQSLIDIAVLNSRGTLFGVMVRGCEINQNWERVCLFCETMVAWPLAWLSGERGPRKNVRIVPVHKFSRWRRPITRTPQTITFVGRQFQNIPTKVPFRDIITYAVGGLLLL